jgi:hypothetical protein
MPFKLINKCFFREYGLLLVSAGGSGCTAIHKLLDKMNVSKNNTNDEDYLKHLSSPQQNIYLMNNYKSVVYLYNDPLLAIISHYSRGWEIMQHKKLVDSPQKLCIDEISSIEKLQENTLKKQFDIFGVQQHFLNWIELSEVRSNFAVVNFRNVSDVRLVFKQIIGKDINYSIEERSLKSKTILKNLDKNFIDLYKNIDNNNIDIIEKLKSSRNLIRIN